MKKIRQNTVVQSLEIASTSSNCCYFKVRPPAPAGHLDCAKKDLRVMSSVKIPIFCTPATLKCPRCLGPTSYIGIFNGLQKLCTFTEDITLRGSETWHDHELLPWNTKTDCTLQLQVQIKKIQDFTGMKEDKI